MSKFWAAGSSSESESGSDSESEDEQQTQRQAGGKFGSTFQESDSGTYQRYHLMHLHFTLSRSALIRTMASCITINGKFVFLKLT